MEHMFLHTKHMVSLSGTADKKNGMRSSNTHMHAHVVNVFTHIAIMLLCSNISLFDKHSTLNEKQLYIIK